MAILHRFKNRADLDGQGQFGELPSVGLHVLEVAVWPNRCIELVKQPREFQFVEIPAGRDDCCFHTRAENGDTEVQPIAHEAFLTHNHVGGFRAGH